VTTFTVEPTGLREVAEKMSADLTPQIKAATMEIAAAFQGVIAPYAPSSGANTAGRSPYWYQRGFGVKYPGGGGRQTSQTLGRKWSLESAGPTSVNIINTASYAPYVHLAEYQAWFHAERGWKTDEDAQREIIEGGIAQQIMSDRINEVLKS